MVTLLYWIAKLELETIKVEIADFAFFTVRLESILASHPRKR